MTVLQLVLRIGKLAWFLGLSRCFPSRRERRSHWQLFRSLRLISPELAPASSGAGYEDPVQSAVQPEVHASRSVQRLGGELGCRRQNFVSILVLRWTNA